MTMQQHGFGNGVAPHFELERFQTYAAAELAASPPWQAGVCFNPSCSRQFELLREWQIYCCETCKRTGTAEMRRIGHQTALPLLVWRMGKYEKNNEAVREVTRAARRYVAHAQSAWLADREHRIADSGGQNGSR